MCPVVALEWWCAVSERGAKREATEGSGIGMDDVLERWKITLSED